jgi:REP element-mobilizing transposase RayT
MSEYIHKSHNVSVLLYHLVCPSKYRKVIFSKEVDNELKDVCLEIAKRYEIMFIEIGVEENHVHFLIQSVPTYSPTRITTIVKSIIAREIFRKYPDVKKKLWGGEFWTKGFFINTVGQYASEEVIRKYVKRQGKEKEYKRLHKQAVQLEMF